TASTKKAAAASRSATDALAACPRARCLARRRAAARSSLKCPSLARKPPLHEEPIMSLYRILSALLMYPEQPLIDALLEIDDALDAHPEAQDQLSPLTDYLKTHSLIELQENYVATFDRQPACSLHLFEHVHGESRDRGQAMVDLLQEYRRHGLEPGVAELPDHVPLFLEFVGVIEPAQAGALLDDAIHVLAAIGARLGRDGSPYSTVFAVLRGMTDGVARVRGSRRAVERGQGGARVDGAMRERAATGGRVGRDGSPYSSVFAVLRGMTDVVPREQAEPPVRDMDEALEVYGVGPDGVEPLLPMAAAGTHVVHFHPRSRGAQH